MKLRNSIFLLFLLTLKVQIAQAQNGSDPLDSPNLYTPADNATDVGLELLLGWDEVNNAIGYELQLATDIMFEDIAIYRNDGTDYSLRFNGNEEEPVFSGEVADWIEVPNNPAHGSEHQTLTLEGWIKGYGFLGGNIVAGDSHNGRGFGVILIEDYMDVQYGIQTQWYNPTRNDVHAFNVSDVIPNGDQWHHVALTFDHGEVVYYLDGEMIKSQEATSEDSKRIMGDHGQKFIMGARRDLTSGSNIEEMWHYALNGNLTEIRLWNKARTEAEINEHKDDRLTGNEPGLLAYYPLNEGSGMIAGDRAAANDGEIYGATWEELDFTLNREEIGDSTSYQIANSLDYNMEYFWRVRSIGSESTSDWSAISSFTTTDSIAVSSEEERDLIADYSLSQNYPNPFNPSTTIRFNLPEATNIELKVYSIHGQQVANLASGITSAGTHTVDFDGSGLASGIYIYRLLAGDVIKTRRMVLIK